MTRRRLKKVEVRFLSLCNRGANALPVLYKGDDTVELQTMCKMSDEGMLTAVAYAPDIRDNQGDIADAEVVKGMAHSFMMNGAKLDIMHDFKAVPKDKAHVVESFIIQKADPRFVGWKNASGEIVDVTGGWAVVIKVQDPTLRELYREGKWNGVSLAGPCTVEVEKSDDNSLIERFAKAFADKLKPKKDDMEPQVLEAALAKANAPVLTALTALADALKSSIAPKEAKKTDETEEKAPVYRGKPDDEKALLKHERELELFDLRKSADMSTAEGCRAYREAVAELRKAWAEADKTEKPSNQTSTEKKDEVDTKVMDPETGLMVMKSMIEARDLGRKHAKGEGKK